MPCVRDINYEISQAISRSRLCYFLTDNNKEIGFEHVVHYDDGITSDQVMASGSFPVNFDFAKIEVES
jgi:hypothetical protein